MEAPPHSARHAVIFTGGEMCSVSTPDAGTYVIAADSGYDHASAAGVTVDLLVGDMDSISSTGLAAAERSDTVVIRYPQAKDDSDLEIAIDAAVDHGAQSIDIYGGEAGAIDHLLGVALGLTSGQWKHIEITWHPQGRFVRVVHAQNSTSLNGAPGSPVSIVPIGDAVVTTSGLEWPLTGERLPGGTSRGLRNRFIEHEAVITVTAGVVLAIWKETKE